jgi:putative hydrolase of the HAD superfamily
MPLLMCDLDDTLVQRAPLFRAWAEEFLEEQDASPELVEWLVEQDQGGFRPREEFVRAVLERVPSDVPLEELVEEHDRKVSGSYRLTPGVRSALDAAREAGWAFAVVTNGPVFRQRAKIEATGLDDLADAICISGEVGEPKPAAVMFEEAATRAGATLEGAWMIGDNLDADIAGAHGVGARSVWIKRDDDWITFRSGTEPDLVAHDFPDAVRQVLEATSP